QVVVEAGGGSGVGAAPGVEWGALPLSTTLVKSQPAWASSSKDRLWPAAGRLLKVKVALLPVPPEVVMLRGLGTAGLPWPLSWPRSAERRVGKARRCGWWPGRVT